MFECYYIRSCPRKNALFQIVDKPLRIPTDKAQVAYLEVITNSDKLVQPSYMLPMQIGPLVRSRACLVPLTSHR